MTKEIRLGVVNPETWDFFRELYGFMRANYRTTLFEPRRIHVPVLRDRFNGILLKRSLNRLLRNNDVVFFEWASDLLSLATTLSGSARIVTRLHRWELYKWAHLVDWRRVDRVILVSEAKRAEFSQRYPDHRDKVRVIPEFIDCKRFPYSEREFSGSIGILCHLRPRKRVYELVLAFSELVQQNPSLTLHIGGNAIPGETDYYEALLGLVERLSLGKHVRFDGYVGDPAQWYKKIDIFISNGYSEGLQVSPMEAMASGCYVLAHRWHGAEELLPDDCLYFTNAELARKVIDYCRLPGKERENERMRMRNIAVRKFDFEANKEKIGAIIDSLGGAL